MPGLVQAISSPRKSNGSEETPQPLYLFLDDLVVLTFALKLMQGWENHNLYDLR